LGKVNANDVALVVGNHVRNGSLTPATLKHVLSNAGKFGNYAGVVADSNLYNEKLDSEISIRFQTVFLPVDDKELAKLEFTTEAYNYQTLEDDNPRNLVLLCTTQGVAFTTDGAGSRKLFHHALDKDGQVHNYWLEAERSRHQVGGAQVETEEEAAAAAARGKATSSVIGVKAMGTRFNVLMTIQVPTQPRGRWFGAKPSLSLSSAAVGGAGYGGLEGMTNGMVAKSKGSEFMLLSCRARSPSAPAAPQKIGTTNAARVSRGSEAGVYSGVKNTTPTRDESQHCTVTVVMYYTVAGGVPSEADVVAAIDDLESLYAACHWDGRLADDGASFMKSELTGADVQQVVTKVTTQPYTQGPVVGAKVFPE